MKGKRKTVALLLACAMALTVPMAAFGDGYTDVCDDSWYAEAVSYVSDKGLMNGVSDESFGPSLTTTRGMIVTILYRLDGEPEVDTQGQAFNDVDESAYYAKAAYWAKTNDITSGYSDDLFGPKDAVSREQLAVMLRNYAAYKGVDVSQKPIAYPYPDMHKVSIWATSSMEWANLNKIINGDEYNCLRPKQSATRAEVASMLMRLEAAMEKPAKGDFQTKTDRLSITEPVTLYFSSGVANWQTSITINPDLTFTGAYYDVDMGTNTRYYAHFKGNFSSDITRTTMYGSELTLESFEVFGDGNFVDENGLENIFVKEVPGLMQKDNESAVCTSYMFYMPDEYVGNLNADFIEWYTGKGGQLYYNMLGTQALENTTTHEGFFGEPMK